MIEDVEEEMYIANYDCTSSTYPFFGAPKSRILHAK